MTTSTELRKTSADSSRRSRNLSTRRKTKRTSQNHQVVQQETRIDRGQLKILLENLDIRFINCSFTYKQSHFDDPATVLKRRSKLVQLRSKVFSSFEKVREVITCEKTFNSKCLYVPAEEKDKVKDFILTNFQDVKLSFEDCKFYKRSSSLTEKIRMRLRKMFGIQFELEYFTSTATVHNYTFRIKDIMFINQHVQERIVEDA